MTKDPKLLLNAGRFVEAEAALRASLVKVPKQAGTLEALGFCLFHQGRLRESVAAYREALALEAGRGSTWYNLGISLSDLGEVRQAVDAYRSALMLDPENESAAYNLSRALLLLGEWQEGFKLFEARGRKASPLYTKLDFERWTGEGPGKYVLVLTTEQGIGDAIQFVRYAPLLKRMGYQVVLWTDPKLVDLLKRVPDIGPVVAGRSVKIEGAPVKWSPLMSVPAALGTTREKNIPPAPYLVPDFARTAQWTERIGRRGFKVGLAWQGHPAHARDRWRSIPLVALEPLAQVGGVRFISLQKQPGSNQIGNVAFGDKIEIFENDSEFSANALLDAAAIVNNLDLVITVDTMIAHLAGAIGRPVWLALDTAPDWRWLLNRTDTPWYPSMQLFRQRNAGDWSSVVGELVEALHGAVFLRANDSR